MFGFWRVRSWTEGGRAWQGGTGPETPSGALLSLGRTALWRRGAALVFLGTLILLFPLVLALVVAGALYVVGVGCLVTAGRLWWNGRSRRQGRVEVRVIDPEDVDV